MVGVLVNGMLLAQRIPEISDHDGFVAHLFRVKSTSKGRTTPAVEHHAGDYCGASAKSVNFAHSRAGGRYSLRYYTLHTPPHEL